MRKFITALSLFLLAVVSTQAETIQLNIDDVYCNHYTDPKFSSPGHYDYFLNSGNTQDPNGMPWLYIHVYQTVNTGLVTGSYSMEAGNVDRILLFTSMDDYNTYRAGTLPHVFVSANVEITQQAESLWRIQFEGTTDEGTTYVADFQLTKPASNTTDKNDPNKFGQTGGGDGPVENPAYAREPHDATEFDIAFDRMTWLDARTESLGMTEIQLECDDRDADDMFYLLDLQWLSFANKAPKAGTYPINSSDEDYTFWASDGWASGSISPSFLVRTDGESIAEEWYLVSGSVTISYPAERTIRLQGEAKTYFGSTVKIFFEGDMPDNMVSGLRRVTTTQTSAQRYDLQGRTLSRLKQGIVVENGSKLMVR